MCAAASSKVASILERSFVFKEVDVPTMERLRASGRLRAFAPGQVLVKEGDQTGDVILVHSGKLKVATRNAAGEEVVLAELGAGAVLGEVAAVTHTKRTSTATALELVEAVIIPSDVMQDILASHPKIRELLMRLVENRAMDAMAKLTH